MVSPLIPQILKGETLRNWLRTDGAGIFRAFETGVSALSYIREHFGAIRTQDFYQIRREALAVSLPDERLSDYPGNQLIPKAWHVTDHGLDLSTEYQYRVELFGYDPNTGEIRHNYMTIATDRQLTQHEIQDASRNYIGGGGESGDLILERFGEIRPLRRK